MTLRFHSLWWLLLSMLHFFSLHAQPFHTNARIEDRAFDQVVRKYLQFTVPVIDVDSLYRLMHSNVEDIYILDARAKEEYEVSRIPHAQYIGYPRIDEDVLSHIPKDSKIIVYCSIGYRSEKIGEQLCQMGYRRVYNLYGSIFEWVNRGYPVVDSRGDTVRRVHTYNRKWSRWVLNTAYEKVY